MKPYALAIRVTKFKVSMEEALNIIITRYSQYMMPRAIAYVIEGLYKYGSIVESAIGYMVWKHGRVYAPISLHYSFYNTEQILRVMKYLRLVEWNYDLELLAKYIGVEKLIVDRIVFEDKTYRVERIPMNYIPTRILKLLLQLVVPRDRRKIRGKDASFLYRLKRLGYIKCKNYKCYTASPEIYYKAYEELVRRWNKFKRLAYSILLDIALHNSGFDQHMSRKYISHTTIRRLINTYKLYASMPVKIVDDEDLYGLLELVLDDPKSIYAIPCLGECYERYVGEAS